MFPSAKRMRYLLRLPDGANYRLNPVNLVNPVRIVVSGFGGYGKTLSILIPINRGRLIMI